jgi:cell division protein FtsA
MARNIAAGIDIGTYQIKAVIAEELRDETGRTTPKIIGTGLSDAKGLHHGYITDPSEVARSVRNAMSAAEKAAGMEVRRANISVGGIGLSSVTTTGSIAISRADLEITNLDISKAEEAAEAAIPHALSLNRRIISIIPIEWKIDSKPALGRIEGMKASKLEVKMLFVTCLEHHIEDLITAVEEAGIEVVDVSAAPLAAATVTLSKKQTKAGCVLANIGSETLSIVVYENGSPISLEVFEIGSMDITNDIALGLKIPLEEAESIKLGSVTRATYSKKKYEEIIAARLSDMFELIEAHLKKIGRNALLPAGIIITGGGAAQTNIQALAESALKLPSRTAEIHFGDVEKRGSKDAIWAVAFGLTLVAFNSEDGAKFSSHRPSKNIVKSGKDSVRQVARWFSKFLP